MEKNFSQKLQIEENPRYMQNPISSVILPLQGVTTILSLSIPN